ncbi:MHS family MFS transporter [Arthrobacter sp. CAU 1506]|uniref:MFS transporter n=1 Tax=Arthrobacter sp. CAU 1506 TaxID=2560052 RepID=UPI0010ACCBD3|nr:MFS transporter [Arthrobacter sp. CAU 1506]TJY66216.1 MHS family MFS transporter [Arthrobacter sp. CAU 1506]
MTIVKNRGGRPVIAATIGTSLEWYDYFLYGSMAVIVFPAVFFPSGDPLISTLVSVSTFGLGFLVRPLGAFVFGRIGDRLGRRDALMYTMVLMGVATLAIALTPGFNDIGIWAPIVVIIARLLQGLSAGGEWGGAVLMSVEQSPNEASLGAQKTEKAGFFGSFVQAASPIGLMLSNAAILGVSLLGPEALTAWAWRVPFFIGGLIAIVGIIIRLSVQESAVFEAMRNQDALSSTPIASAFRHDLGAMILVALTYMGVGTIFYVAVIFGQSYGKGVGLTQPEMSLIIVAFAFAMLVASIIAGAHSDRIGHKRSMLIGLAGCALYAPLWILMFSSGAFALSLLSFVILAVIFSYCWAPMAAFFARAMSTASRYSSLSIGYQMGSILGGALPPIIAVWMFGTTGSIWAILGYIVLTLIISLLAATRLTQHTVKVRVAVSEAS